MPRTDGETPRRIMLGMEALAKMANGDWGCSPEWFDRRLADLGVAPADIDSTTEAIVAAKRQWQVAMGKNVFTKMARGDDGCTPEWFDGWMRDLDLTPADIDSTTEGIATAK